MSIPPILTGKMHCQHMSVMGLKISALQIAQDGSDSKNRTNRTVQQRKEPKINLDRRRRLSENPGQSCDCLTVIELSLKEVTLVRKTSATSDILLFQKRLRAQVLDYYGAILSLSKSSDEWT
jgi:hypothetical protein